MSRMLKKEFPFSLAVLIAALLHLVLGLALRQHAILVAAIPVAPLAQPVSPSPVSVRFVEVPPESPAIQEAPDTPYYSDANRRADPSPRKANPSPRSMAGAQNAQPSSPWPRMDSAGQTEGFSGEKEIDGDPDESSTAGVASIPGGTQGKIGNSLQNLDRYLPSGAGSWGNVRQEDSGSGVFFDTKGHDLGPWANRVIAMVRGNWIVPVAASLGMKGVVGVAFEVDRSGKVLTPQIVTSSGVVSFDQASINAIRSSDPLPPLPDYFPLPRLSAVFRFYYNMAIPNT